MLTRSMLQHGLSAAALSLMLILGVSASHAQDTADTEETQVRDIRSLNLTEKRKLAALLQEEFQRIVDKQKAEVGLAPYTRVSVNFETHPENEWLVTELGAANGPISPGALIGELMHSLGNAAFDIFDEIGVSHPVYDYRFGGRTMRYYDPSDPQYRLEAPPQPEGELGQTAIPPQGAKVVVSAMHGYYWRTVDKKWQLQRPELSNGLYEDLLTPKFVAPLKGFLTNRSGATVHLPRSQSQETHPGSGKPWWQIAGRYYLKELYPNNKDIWHSLDQPLPGPNHGPNLWHYDEDIRSRPRYANHIDADALINLHTNASDNASANGARAYVARNRPYDLKLANNMLCGMKELIHAQEAYKNFRVNDQAESSGLYGENNQAQMPAVVLEVGFHTNASDAAALKDPAFREAAMKGVEKGLRLQAKGKVCTPFKITSIPNVNVPRPGSKMVPINFEGFPRFPITQTTEVVECPTSCTGGTITYDEWQASPLRFEFTCSGSADAPQTSRWRTYLTDIDGVKTNAVEPALTCTPTASTVNATGRSTMSVGPAR